ncbi:MAG: LacI family transcriptional regulator [Spirochaetia bacterium]|nr:LacI family transcriptional regulator [Spirochaetia bacterium]
MSTIKDVARLAGVSTATVSLALNGKPVNEATRRLVKSCAKKLNYVPNRSGRTLITGKSSTILLVILNSVKYTNLVADTTFFYNYIEGLLEIATEHGYSLTFDVKNWEDDDLDEYFHRKIQGKGIDGIIIIPQFMRPYSFLEVLGDFPVVFLNSYLKGERISSLYVDNYWGGRLVAQYFQRCGFRKIGFINGPEEHYDASERKRGFFDVLGTSHNIIEAFGDWSARSGYEAAGRILSQRKVDALFCGNDFMASGVMRYLYTHLLEIPGDVSIIGYDNTSLSSSLYPRLSTVDGQLREIGKGLGYLLFSLLNSNSISVAQFPVIKPKLVIRESSRPYG